MTCWISRAGRGACPALAFAGALLLSSCEAKKVPIVPDDGVEGEPSPSQLVVYPDTPIHISTYQDTLPVGPGPEDRLLSVEEIYPVGPGVVHGMIFDFTPAERFEVFRHEADGFRLLKDFDLYPVKKLVAGQMDIYRFTDPRPRPPGLREYLARGVVGGVVTARAPKTNVARLQINAVSGLLDFTASTGFPPDPRVVNFRLAWAPVQGAAGYWVHVFQYTDQGGDEIIASTFPAPLYIGVTRDYLVAYMRDTSYTFEDPPPPGVIVAVQRPILPGGIYNVRVSAVDADGQLIAFTGESEATVVFRGEGFYRSFPLGAARVQTALPPCGDPPLPPCPSPGLLTEPEHPGFEIYPAGTFRAPRR